MFVSHSDCSRADTGPAAGAGAGAADADAGASAGNSTPSHHNGGSGGSYALCLLEEATPALRAGRQQFESFSCRLVGCLPKLPVAVAACCRRCRLPAACFDVCTFAVRLVENPTNCLF